MLVKFLSYVVSVFGTKRYKPVLLVCAVLIMSLVGLTAATARLTGTSDTTAASSIKDAEEDGASDTQPLSKQGLKQQPAASSNEITETTTLPEQAPATATPDTTPPVSSTTPSLAEINVISTLNLKNDGETAIITASTNDNSTVQWSVSTDSADIHIVQNQGAERQFAANHSFSLKAAASASTNATYKVKVSAKDTTRGIELVSKTILVTISKE